MSGKDSARAGIDPCGLANSDITCLRLRNFDLRLQMTRVHNARKIGSGSDALANLSGYLLKDTLHPRANLQCLQLAVTQGSLSLRQIEFTLGHCQLGLDSFFGKLKSLLLDFVKCRQLTRCDARLPQIKSGEQTFFC